MSEEPQDSPQEGQPTPSEPEPSDSPFLTPPMEEVQKGLNPFERETGEDDRRE